MSRPRAIATLFQGQISDHRPAQFQVSQLGLRQRRFVEGDRRAEINRHRRLR